MFVVIIVALLIYICLPWPLQIILFAVNFFLPDPIPVLDEVIMLTSIFSKLKFFTRISDMYEKHKALTIFLVVLGLGAIIAFVVVGGKTIYQALF